MVPMDGSAKANSKHIIAKIRTADFMITLALMETEIVKAIIVRNAHFSGGANSRITGSVLDGLFPI